MEFSFHHCQFVFNCFYFLVDSLLCLGGLYFYHILPVTLFYFAFKVFEDLGRGERSSPF